MRHLRIESRHQTLEQRLVLGIQAVQHAKIKRALAAHVMVYRRHVQATGRRNLAGGNPMESALGE
jgi:hypothetical protein